MNYDGFIKGDRVIVRPNPKAEFTERGTIKRGCEQGFYTIHSVHFDDGVDRVFDVSEIKGVMYMTVQWFALPQ